MQVKILKKYPYPILTEYSDDYFDSIFLANAKLEHKGLNYLLHVEYTLVNQEIADLIKNDMAEFVAHIECASSSFRSIHKSDIDQIDIDISHKDIIGKIELSCFIIAKKEISNYTNSKFNDDYKNFKFKIYPGAPLAVAQTREFIISNLKQYGSNQSIISFKFREGNKTKNFCVDFEGDIIYFSIPDKTTYNNILRIYDTEYAKLISSLIVTPGLIYILEHLKNCNELYLYTDKLWFKTINERLKHITDIDLSDPESLSDMNSLDIAQTISDNNIWDSIAAVNSLMMEPIKD